MGPILFSNSGHLDWLRKTYHRFVSTGQAWTSSLIENGGFNKHGSYKFLMEEDCLCYMKQWACLLALSYQKLPGMLHCMLRNKLYTYGNNGDMDFNYVNTIASTCEHSMIAGNTYKPWHSKIMLLHPIYYQGNIQLYQTWVKTTFALFGFTIYMI